MSDTPPTGAGSAGSRDPADDDQQWFDLIAGREAGDARPSLQHEAAWLRAALLTYRAHTPEGLPPPPEARIGPLLARARAAGVLPPAAVVVPSSSRSRPGDTGRAWARSRSWPWALAAAIAVLAVGLPVWQARFGLPDEAPVMRGPSEQRLVVGEPQQHQAALVQALREAGFDAHPYERLGRLGVDIALPEPLSAGQAEALRAWGLTVPSGPTLQVEIVPAVR